MFRETMKLRRAHIKAGLRALKRYLIDLPLLVERQRYLLSEVRTLRKQLNEDRASLYPTVQQTKDSFAYQWKNIPSGRALPSDAEWLLNLDSQIGQYFDEEDYYSAFKGKTVLDYGCGGGRYALGFCRLGADVSVYDVKDSIVKEAIILCANHGYHVKPHQGLLDRYDYVWCFGVVHHTGRTYHYIYEAIQRLKPGGKLFLMVYGVPETLAEYAVCNYYEDIRNKTATMTFDERLKYLTERYPDDQVHGMFDAVSPQVADLLTWQELHGLLTYLGMTDIKRTLIGHRNHHLVARKKK